MSRRGEMVFLQDEFDHIFLRAAWPFIHVILPLLGSVGDMSLSSCLLYDL